MEKLPFEKTTNKNQIKNDKNSKENTQLKKITPKDFNMKKPTKSEDKFSSKYGETEQERLLKESKLKKYSKYEILKKEIFFSGENYISIITKQISRFILLINSYIQIKLPIYKGDIINAINKKNNTKLINSVIYFFFFSSLNSLIPKFIEYIKLLVLDYYNAKTKKIPNQFLLENILTKDMEFYEIFKTGEIIERYKSSQKTMNLSIFKNIIDLLRTIVTFLIMIYYIYQNSFKLLLWSLGFYLFEMINLYFTKGEIDIFAKRVVDNSERDMFNNSLYETISNIKLAKSFGVEKREAKRLLSIFTKKENSPKNAFFLELLKKVYKFFYIILMQNKEIILLFITGKEVINGKMKYGDYLVFKTYFSKFKKSYLSIKNFFQIFEDNITAWKRFFEVYEYENKIISKNNIIPESNTIKGEIKFNNVTFSYPTKEKINILNNLSFEIKAGTLTAIVGHSGSGKSTIINLIERFYDPNSGEILIDNINIKDYNIEWLHKKIGFVNQEPLLNSGTIEQNILYGVEEYNQNKFNEICKIANVDNFVNDKNLFPDGYNTIVGEKGKAISGGQKQRIAIARALMVDYKILIFDEATSALDSENESQVQNAIDNIVKNKQITTIVIAHRLSTVKNADIIMFIDKGRIVEMGSHEELILKNGEYKKLVQKQLIS